MRKTLIAVVATAAVALTGCSSNNPTSSSATESRTADKNTVVIGTANFPESEIIGQVWKAALEKAGYKVEMKSGIGSREAYIKAIEDGSVDIVPEYIGSLAQYYKAYTPMGSTGDQLNDNTRQKLPEKLATSALAPGEDADSFKVLPETAQKYGLKEIGDLNKLDHITLAGPPELASRPHGPSGLESTYGIPQGKISLNSISDGGGPLTISALTEHKADVANIFTTSPTVDSKGNKVETVTLADPKRLILPEHVTALYRKEALDGMKLHVIEKINASLTTDQLTQFNEANVGSQKKEPASIASDFVKNKY